MKDHPYDLFEAFALGDLDPAAQEAVLAHADACAVCAPLLAEAMTGVAAVARADGERGDGAIGVALKRELNKLGGYKRDRYSLRNAGWWAAAASAAAAIVFGGVDLQMRSNAPVVPVNALVHSHFTHHPLVGAGGEAKMLQALDGSWVYVVADHLRPGAEYSVQINGSTLGVAVAAPDGTLTAYWNRPTDKITSAELVGPGGTALRWP
jgi:hypothetical protein